MSRAHDTWYIRLPGGQEIKAKSTTAVIHHVQNGTIPKTSRARRSRDDEWMQLEWHAEFTEAVTGVAPPKSPAGDRPDKQPDSPPLSGVAARLDPLRLRTVGIRGLWDDLIAALDSTFVRRKLFIAAVACCAVGFVWGLNNWLAGWLAHWLQSEADSVVRFSTALTVVAGLMLFAIGNGLLARITHVELSNIRPARFREATYGFFNVGLRLVLAYLLILGGVYVLMRLIHWGPTELNEQSVRFGLIPELVNFLPALLSAVGLIVEILLWALVGLSLLLAPLLVVEDLPLSAGIREWCALIREHFSRAALAEALALALGGLITVPIALPVYFAVQQFPHLPEPLQFAAYGLFLAPLLAFMAVANVFIYLDLKYERN
jgi:hypothetical protein